MAVKQRWIACMTTLIMVAMMIPGRVAASRGISRLAFASTGQRQALRHSLIARLSTETEQVPIWNQPLDSKRRKEARVRQHVNPLSRRYQQPTFLSKEWPSDVLTDLALPLHLDIGCGRGGFLLKMAAARPDQNYVGLEIRPPIYQYAVDRIEKRGLVGRLTFVGCNANVDLDRILSVHQSKGGGPLKTVSIQFPDPHFKSQHAKRRVVTRDLVLTLAKYMPEASMVFLQSDIKEVLDDMRLRFREQDLYFQDELQKRDEYLRENPMGIETERECSCLEKGLPVYRTILLRTAAECTD